MYMNICTVGMEVVGIFRRTPATATIKAMKEQFNQGMIVSTHTHTHTHRYTCTCTCTLVSLKLMAL